MFGRPSAAFVTPLDFVQKLAKAPPAMKGFPELDLRGGYPGVVPDPLVEESDGTANGAEFTGHHPGPAGHLQLRVL